MQLELRIEKLHLTDNKHFNKLLRKFKKYPIGDYKQLIISE